MRIDALPAMKHVRAMDALHVACALAVEPDIFVSADHRQLSAARKAGLRIADVFGA
jgi:predicted nucleic acid-binding protein